MLYTSLESAENVSEHTSLPLNLLGDNFAVQDNATEVVEVGAAAEAQCVLRKN